MKLTDESSEEEIFLPNSLLWVDELDWSPSIMSTSFSLTGALLVDVGVKQSGRLITLEPPESGMSWVSRATVLTLREWANDPMRVFTLTLEYPEDTRSFTVMFRHSDGAIKSSPVKGFPEHHAAAWFSISLKLIEVAV